MKLSPDEVVLWRWGPIVINATLLWTWVVMAVLVLASWWTTRRLRDDAEPSRLQQFLEMVVLTINGQIREVSQDDPQPYLPFIGTLFLFIAVANGLSVIPGYHPPTGSLSTAAALACCVMLAVPIYGVARQGFFGYLKQYLKPTPIMLPFHIISELSRTLALAVRLFGNVMSGGMLVAILFLIAPLFFPLLAQALDLMIGMIQAYIFAILAMVYIASATRVQQPAASADAAAPQPQTHEGDPSHG